VEVDADSGLRQTRRVVGLLRHRRGEARRLAQQGGLSIDGVRVDDVDQPAPADRPAFDRVESALLLAFSGMPQLQVPDVARPRLFEIRRYEAPGETAGLKKIEMFDTGGELEIFRKVGFRPVFFGQTLYGVRLPQFEYMLAYDNMADRETRWTAFRNDPDWKVLSQKEEYKDARIMSGATSTYLVPMPASQI